MTGAPIIDGVTDMVEIGRGGFGVVYRGTETAFGRTVAVKVLLPSVDDRSRKRFERERRAMGALSGHPNIVTVYRGGFTASDQPYLVMEYLPGGSLADRLEAAGPLDWRKSAELGAKLAEALHVAHRAGVLHRDVKPANVFLTDSGEPKLGDFGIARLDDGNDSRSGSITASVAHAPPEIIDGERGDERADLYSLASTVYAMTRGSAPFSADPDQRLAALLSRIANEAPASLHLEDAATGFERTLLRGLSKKPEDRHATVSEFGAALRQSALAQAPPRPASQHAPATPMASHAAVAPPAASTSPIAAHQPAPTTPLHQADQADQAVTTSRQTSPVMIAVMAALALAVASFGGWAVSRALLSDDEQGDTVAAVAGSQVEPTPEATRVPPTQTPAEPTPVPPTPTPPPTPTQVPPTPAPTALAGGSRGSSLNGVPAGFTRVSDSSGAITVNVPDAWATTIEDSASVQGNALPGIRALAVGSSIQQLSGGSQTTDLTDSGIYIFVARVGTLNNQNLLDVGLSFWPDCLRGDQAEILLPDGNANYQILECARSDGQSTGVVVLGMVVEEDPEVGVTMFLQFGDFSELGSLVGLLSNIDVDPTLIPTASS